MHDVRKSKEFISHDRIHDGGAMKNNRGVGVK